MRENTYQKKLRIWTLFTQWFHRCPYGMLKVKLICKCLAIFIPESLKKMNNIEVRDLNVIACKKRVNSLNILRATLFECSLFGAVSSKDYPALRAADYQQII